MESFAAKHEKSVFRGLFGNNSDDSSDSSSSDEEENDKGIANQVDDDTSGCITTVFNSDIGNIKIEMVEQKSLGIAHQLWPAAKYMCNFLEANNDIFQSYDKNSLNVLELGAGIGLCGLFVSLHCEQQYSKDKIKVVLTDLPEAIDRLNQNIALNNLDNTVSADVLSWGSTEDLDRVFASFSSPPLVLAADCVYWECLFIPLFTTLKALTDRGCEVIISHVKRWKRDAKFFALCRKNHLMVDVLVETVEMVPAEHTGIPTRTITRVYRIKAELK